MTNDEKMEFAMDLLERVDKNETLPPDATWYRDYYVLTGEHMILTDEGWCPGMEKQALIDEYLEDGEATDTLILDEVNAPVPPARTWVVHSGLNAMGGR
jgi:hypothetical protein